jgi:hypothetical protein
VVHWDRPGRRRTVMEMVVVRSDHDPSPLIWESRPAGTCLLMAGASGVVGTRGCGVASIGACEIACWLSLGHREESLSGNLGLHSSDLIEMTLRTAHL